MIEEVIKLLKTKVNNIDNGNIKCSFPNRNGTISLINITSNYFSIIYTVKKDILVEHVFKMVNDKYVSLETTYSKNKPMSSIKELNNEEEAINEIKKLIDYLLKGIKK